MSIWEEREHERMDREDAMVANYDPADHARGVDDEYDPEADEPDSDCCYECWRKAGGE